MSKLQKKEITETGNVHERNKRKDRSGCEWRGYGGIRLFRCPLLIEVRGESFHLNADTYKHE